MRQPILARTQAAPLVLFTSVLFFLLCLPHHLALASARVVPSRTVTDSLSLRATNSIQPTDPPSFLVTRDDDTQDHEELREETIRSTQSNEVVIVEVTTVVVVAGGGNDQQVIDNDHGNDKPSSTQAAQNPQIQDPNQNGAIEDQLQDDQEALNRMQLILSLVCGIGGVALIGGVVVFTRLRIRKKRMRAALENAETSNPSENEERHSMQVLDNSRRSGNNDNNDGNTADQPPSSPSLLLPSAPPVPFEIADPPSERRHVVSLQSQLTPAPSAPPAKELDADDDAAHDTLYPIPHRGTSLPIATSSSCPHCHDAPPVPEVPPPAYTPSAPPLYALQLDHAPTEQVSSSSLTSRGSSTSTQDGLLLSQHRDQHRS